jgi:hypothetical protein
MDVRDEWNGQEPISSLQTAVKTGTLLDGRETEWSLRLEHGDEEQTERMKP